MIGCKSDLEKLEEVKKIILSLLISSPEREITLSHLSRLYKEQTDENIPHLEFNFVNLKDFLYEMRDAFYLDYNENNELCVYHVDSEKSQHIKNLVKKQKKSHRSERVGSKYADRSNLIDPRLLFYVLKESMVSISFIYKNKRCVKKSDVLSKINSYGDGVHLSYTISALSYQLNELTHLLTHDDDFIYFKDEFFNKQRKENKTSKKSIAVRKILSDKNSHVQDCKSATQTRIQMNSLSDLVKNSTKVRLQKLVEKYPNGIRCCDIPKEYLNEFKLELEYCDIGFNSVIEFIHAIPDTLKIVKLSDEYKVFDSRRFQNLQNFQKSTLKPISIIDENKRSNLKHTLPHLTFKQNQLLISDDSINFNDSVEQISVNSVFKNPGTHLRVIVTEVYNPSKFWVILYKNRRVLKELMNELQDFYIAQDLNKYTISVTLLQPGLHIACKFSEVWHRGIIQKVGSKKLKIFFYDFGTVQKYKKEKVYLLDKRFTDLSAQAILCGLSDVKPRKSEDKKWPVNCSQKFSEKVLNERFHAYISKIDEQYNSMMINLIDRNHIQISEWMIKEKLAKQGEVLYCKKNINFKDY